MYEYYCTFFPYQFNENPGSIGDLHEVVGLRLPGPGHGSYVALQLQLGALTDKLQPTHDAVVHAAAVLSLVNPTSLAESVDDHSLEGFLVGVIRIEEMIEKKESYGMVIRYTFLG